MENVQEIQRALEHLPSEQKWQIAQWLLEELEEASQTGAGTHSPEDSAGVLPQPDYGGRRQRIFGEKVLPNMVLLARAEDRW
jgi:hypothetical protein